MEIRLEKVVSDLKFPEGPAYDGRGAIYCSNCDADYITRLDADGTVSVAYRAAPDGGGAFTFKKTNGMTFFRDGSLFACDFGRNAIIRIHPDGTQESYVDNYEGRPLEAPNDLAFDPQGNLYFTAPGGSGRDNPVGPLYRVDHDTRRITKVADGMAFPNGLAFTADAKFLYVCESQFDRILRFAVAPDGSLYDKHVFADLSPDGPGEPDGMALDAEGNLWITHYGRHTVLIVNSQGEIVQTIALPVENQGGPTNIVFAGEDLCTVYITDPGTGAMFRMRSETPGLPLFCAPGR
jgi:gluconolactonase